MNGGPEDGCAGAARAPAGIDILSLAGSALPAVLSDLAALRIAVFREWPYLYDGDAAYEEKYLERFSRADGAVVIVARDGAAIVGASTACPLAGHDEVFAAAMARGGYDPARVFYYGESVLLPGYRGRGIGRAFFDRRAAQARALGGFETAAFCAVARDEADPRRPADYRPLDAFWRGQGFVREEGITAAFGWKETSSAGEISHIMQFWTKRL